MCFWQLDRSLGLWGGTWTHGRMGRSESFDSSARGYISRTNEPPGLTKQVESNQVFLPINNGGLTMQAILLQEFGIAVAKTIHAKIATR